MTTIRSGSAKLPKRPLLALLNAISAEGFSPYQQDVYGRKLGSDVVAFLRLLPGFGPEGDRPRGFLMLPAVGLYYESLDQLSHEFRGSPYPRSEPYEHIGCTLDVLTPKIPRGGVWFAKDGSNAVDGARAILAALKEVALPALEAMKSLQRLIDILKKPSIAPWSAIPRDLVPLAYIAAGQHGAALAAAHSYLRELLERETPDSPLLRSYASFVSAIGKRSDLAAHSAP